MESSLHRPTPDEAAAALTDARSAQQRLATEVAVPSWFSTSLGVAVAVQIATAAVGVAATGHDQPGARSLAVIMAGVVVFLAVAAVQLWRFRQLNGVWLGGFASRVVFGTGMAASLSYGAGLGLALWAAYEEMWVLVALAASAGGVAYAISGRRWVDRYRAAPEANARGESALLLGALVVLAIASLVLLVVSAS